MSSISVESSMEVSSSAGRKNRESAPLLSSRRNFLSRIFRRSGSRSERLVEAADVNSTGVGRQNGLGTFSGVAAPVALSQISTLLFLRLGFLVANFGWGGSMFYLCVAYGILMITITSVSAISTNGLVEGGGVYFMISRTLGPEAGGAIGALFFAANVFSSALYATGCLEGIMDVFGESSDNSTYNLLPDKDSYRFVYASSLNFINMILCLIGAKLFAKATVGTLAMVLVCTGAVIISFIGHQEVIEVPLPANNPFYPNHTANYTGFMKSTFLENLWPDFTLDYTTNEIVDFSTVFGVLFTGVTGIMAGANMSGELQSPGKSIPRGTMGATIFTGLLYAVLITLTALSSSRYLLTNDYMFMASVNYWPPFVTIGIITATMSASLSCLIGASRVLAALVKDNLYGCVTGWIGKLDRDGNPFGSVILSALLVEFVFMIGELNTIARFTSVFFLLSYCAVNLATVLLECASPPNFRPTFTKYSPYLSMCGAIGIAVLMVVISPITALIAVMITFLLIASIYVYGPIAPYQWGSLSQALIFHQVRKYLLKLDSRKDHVKFWRPQILLLVTNHASACPLIHFVNDLKKSGLYLIGNVQIQASEAYEIGASEEVSSKNESICDRRQSTRDHMALMVRRYKTLVEHLRVKAFAEVTTAPELSAGVEHLVRLSGLGAMKPNTVVVGFSDNSESKNFLTDSEAFSAITPSYRMPTHDLVDLELLRDWPVVRDPISSLQYVAVLREICALQKNLFVARHFNLFDKAAIIDSPGKKFIDIWPINFLMPNDVHALNKCSLFFLNLAQVLNMVSTWKKKSQLRVFVCTANDREESAYIKEVEESMVKYRIKAKVVNVPWGHLSSMVAHSQYDYENTSSGECGVNFEAIGEEYLNGVNQLIRDKSTDTAVSFVYLATPPVKPASFGHYYRCLDALTQHLHPTLMCNGIDEVTTTLL